jgi:hypothetical protein
MEGVGHALFERDPVVEVDIRAIQIGAALDA